MNVSIVGGSGFLGRHLYEALKKDQAHSVNILDLTCHEQIEESDFHYLDVTDASTMRGKFKGTDVVFYKAGLMGPAASFENPVAFYDVNLRGLLFVLLESSSAGVKQIVFDSTESVFGPGDQSPFLETQPPSPASVYGATKLMAEHYLLNEALNHPIEAAVLRYPRVVSRDNQTIFSTIAEKVHQKEEIIVTAGGTKRFDFVHLDDVIRWNQWFIDHRKTGIFHVSAGLEVSVMDLAKAFHKVIFAGEPGPKVLFKTDRTLNDQLLPDSLLLSTEHSTRESGLTIRNKNLENFIALFL